MKTWRLCAFPCAALLVTLSGCSSESGVEEGGPDPEQEEIAAWNAAAEELASGKADSARCSGVIVPDRNGFDSRIALTFDDGPDLVKTPQVLDTLAAHGAIGTFFINGKRVTSDAHRELLQRMNQDGHIVGNHTHNHEDLGGLLKACMKGCASGDTACESRCATSSEVTARREVDETHQALVSLGIEPNFFRFPFGSSTCTTADIAREYGYSITGWHIDTADWCFASATGGVGYCAESTFGGIRYPEHRDDIVQLTVRQANNWGGGVLLFHDVKAYTVEKLDEILTALEGAGFRFVPLSDVEAFPLLNGVTPPKTPWIGTTCTQNSECTFTEDGKPGECHRFTSSVDTFSYGFCTIPCEGTCPDKYGEAGTFCTSLDGGETGKCLSKSEVANQDCGDIGGTAPGQADRYIGSSGVSASTATVCLPQ